VRALQFAVALTVGVATTAAAQLATPQQPNERLLILPLMWGTSADSAGAITLSDAVRDRVTQLVKNKVMVVTKPKLCEALAQSGFPCNGLLDDQQARQLARFLQVHAYVTGSYSKSGTNLSADVQMIDIASSGIAGRFTATNGNPGTAAALAEIIAQHIATTVRLSEGVRNCNDERKKGRFAQARAEAQKALVIDPNSTGAYLCIATIFEAQRAPVDSVIAASKLALKGDSCNGTAWEKIASGYQQKGDTLQASEAYISQLCGEPRNTQKRLGIAQLLRQMKRPERAVDVVNDGLKLIPGDPQLLDMKLSVCTESSNFKCALEVWVAKAEHDTALLGDTTFLKPALGAAQQVADTQALLRFTQGAYRHFPSNPVYIRARAGAFELAGQNDSAIAYYRKALVIEPNDVGSSLQIAKALIDRATYDTVEARRRREAKDTVALRRLQEAFAVRVDSARPFLRPGLASPDSGQRLAAAVIMLTAGSKLAQAAAYNGAFRWLDTLLTIVAPRNPVDTLGPKYQVRINASFWYGLSSVLTLGAVYQDMTKAKGPSKCVDARAVFDRLTRTKTALLLGRRVHPPTADQMLGFVAQYEKAKASVQAAFKCKPPLN
jgi:tetratricopeptide (TPR) repeat protein